MKIKIIALVCVCMLALCACTADADNVDAAFVPSAKSYNEELPLNENSTDLLTEISVNESAAEDNYEDIIPEEEYTYLDSSWEYADYCAVHNDGAMLYRAKDNRKNRVIGVDAGHGTIGANGEKIYCHPDQSLKTTGGSTKAGSLKADAQNEGMKFNDGTTENEINLKVAIAFKDRLLAKGYDVLMLREDETIELDLLARTLIANNKADCHISIHYDSDGCNYDKGAFYIAVPDGIKDMPPVDKMWEEHDRLGECLIAGLKDEGIALYDGGRMEIDLIQTSYSTIPSVDMELGNQCSITDDAAIDKIVDGLIKGVNNFFE